VEGRVTSPTEAWEAGPGSQKRRKRPVTWALKDRSDVNSILEWGPEEKVLKLRFPSPASRTPIRTSGTPFTELELGCL
jgi:hypothetical protein